MQLSCCSSCFFRCSPCFALTRLIIYNSYRVGFPGFLISEEMKGLGYKANNGLDDQRLGLRWIKHHIRGFGGDPERITFLGQSAGSGNVQSSLCMFQFIDAILTQVVAGNIHLQSNEPLFEQYISMSGTAFSRPRRSEVGQKAYASLVKGFGVAELSPHEQVRKLLSEVEKMGDQARRYNLGPTVDGDIVPEALVFRNQVEPELALKTFPGLLYCRRILVGDCQFDVRHSHSALER
jgi:carboxylesterase type B